jgi:uncharacterized protein (TIRG00374 family)
MAPFRKLAAPVIGIVTLVLVVSLTDPTKVLAYVATLNPLYLVAAALTEVLGGFLYSLAWFVILKPSGVNTTLKQAYLITMGSLFLIYTTPSGVAAEAARIAMVRKHASGDFGGPTASVLVHRVLYGLGFISVAGFATFLVYGALSSSPIIKTAVTAIVTAGVLIVVVLILAAKANGLRSGVKWIGAKITPFLKRLSITKEDFDPAAVDSTFDTFVGAMSKIVHSPLRLLTSYTLIAARWVLVSVVALLVMYSINFHGVSIWAIMIVMMIAEIVSTTPIGIPGMLGVLDAVVIASYVALGVPPAIATATDLLTRFVLYIVNLPLTGSLFYAYIRGGIKQKASERSVEPIVKQHEPK